MKGVCTVQIEDFREGALRNPKASDSIPAPNQFDVHIVSEFILLAVPLFILHSSLVSIPDTGEPLASFFLLQNAKLADHSGETAAGEAATGEAKEE
jgi:hypothetical protein